MRFTKIIIALAMMSSSLAYAANAKKVEPIDTAAVGIPAPHENRILRYTYSPDVIFRILTAPNFHVQIELGEDEGLKETPVVGDSAQWRLSGGPRNLYVKPLREGLVTSMSVVTNKRTYQFQLVSGKANSVYQMVSFDYPDRDAEIKLKNDIAQASAAAERHRLNSQIIATNVDPANLDFNFTVTGEASFRPTAVYTDGKFTYLRMPNVQDTPAVFLLDDAGNPSLINYKVKPNMIEVERVAKHLLLKLGQAEVKIDKQDQKGFWR